MGLEDTVFDNVAYHRYESGEVKPRHVRSTSSTENNDDEPSEGDHRSKSMKKGRKTMFKSMMKVTRPPMKVTEETKANLGKVHFHLAMLHGMDRFPEVVPSQHGEENVEDKPSHDIFSVIFHLCHAASLNNVDACLSLARARCGLETFVSPLLSTNVPVDFESAKEYLKRAMASEKSPASPRAAAGCLLYQILEDEEDTGDTEKMSVLEDTLELMKLSVEEATMMKEHIGKESRGKADDGFKVGDKVEANYFLEGTFYPAVVMKVEQSSVTVKYDDDESEETLSNENVRTLETPASVIAATVRLSDEQALGTKNTDEQCLFEDYELMTRLAELKAKTSPSEAATLFHEAADLAMNAGKMRTANGWNVRASELEG